MDLRTAFDVLRRRWRPVVAGLLLTAAVAAGVCFTVRVQYQATGNLVLLSGGSTISDNPTENGVSNPYGEFGGTLNATASIIQTVVTSEAVERRLVRDGANGNLRAHAEHAEPAARRGGEGLERRGGGRDRTPRDEGDQPSAREVADRGRCTRAVVHPNRCALAPDQRHEGTRPPSFAR